MNMKLKSSTIFVIFFRGKDVQLFSLCTIFCIKNLAENCQWLTFIKQSPLHCHIFFKKCLSHQLFLILDIMFYSWTWIENVCMKHGQGLNIIIFIYHQGVCLLGTAILALPSCQQKATWTVKYWSYNRNFALPRLWY